MATKAWMHKAKQPPRYACRVVRRCELCGRSRAVYRKFKLCRVCFRQMAHQGLIPGVRKASW
jgi:small subunit ribosomal protein S14